MLWFLVGSAKSHWRQRSICFFECPYSKKIWEVLVKGVMGDQYTADWESLIRLLSTGSSWDKLGFFAIRHVFQSTVHGIWSERNRRRHGEDPSPSMLLIKRIDKEMRNKFTIIRRKGDKDYEGGKVLWFSTR